MVRFWHHSGGRGGETGLGFFPFFPCFCDYWTWEELGSSSVMHAGELKNTPLGLKWTVRITRFPQLHQNTQLLCSKLGSRAKMSLCMRWIAGLRWKHSSQLKSRTGLLQRMLRQHTDLHPALPCFWAKICGKEKWNPPSFLTHIMCFICFSPQFYQL